MKFHIPIDPDLRRAFPSKSLLGAFSSRVRRSLAADLILARLYFTLHTCKKGIRKESSSHSGLRNETEL